MKHKYFPLIAILFFLLTSACFAAGKWVSVTAVEEEKNGKQAIVLNKKLKISGIEVHRNKENNTVKVIYPFYQAKNGRVISQIEILSKELGEAITRSLQERKTEEEKSVDFDYKIDKIDIYKKKDDNIKAFVEIRFNETVLVRARVMQSSHGVWIAWPSAKDNSGRWEKQVVFLDYSLQEKIEKSIIEKYETILSEEP